MLPAPYPDSSSTLIFFFFFFFLVVSLSWGKKKGSSRIC